MKRYFKVLDMASQVIFFIFAVAGVYALSYLANVYFDSEKVSSGISFFIIFSFIISLLVIVLNKIDRSLERNGF